MASQDAKGKNISRKYWKFITYLDSMPDDWEMVADEIGVPLVCSPLHNLDVRTDTHELKKPHYHWIAQFDGPTPYRQALELFRPLGVNVVKMAKDDFEQSASRRRDERYLAHLDSPHKYQYDIADIKCFGGYLCKYLGDRYEQNGIATIHDLAEELGIVYYADLANEIVTNYPELMTTFLRYTAHFNNFMYSRLKLASADNRSYVKSRVRVGRG